MKLLVAFSAFALVNAFGAVSPDLRNLPISFEPNQGQFSNDAQFGARAPGLELSISRRGVRFETRQKDQTAAVQMIWKDGNGSAAIKGEDELPGKTNYIFGNDRTDWKTNVPTYRKVTVHGIYEGVDVVLYGNRNQLEYDLVLAPGADVTAIDLQFKGADKVSLSKEGDLLLKAGGATFEQHRPRVFQERDGQKVEVASKYALRANGDVGFELKGYDRTKQVVIDPVLSFSTIFGGNGTDNANAIALDSSGNIYLAGDTTSSNFPTVQAYQNATTFFNPQHMFVMKLDPTGGTVLFSTYLGGRDYDSARSLAVDVSGNVYVTGYTQSVDYPVTPGALHPPASNNPSYPSDARRIALTKLGSSGSSLIFSSVIGGSGQDYVARIAIDSGGNSFLTGHTNSSDFPVTPGAHNDIGKMSQQFGTYDKVFVTKVNSTGTALIYSAIIGGSSLDDATGLAVDTSGDAYIAGLTESADFPTTSGAYQPNAGSSNPLKGFVLELSPDASSLEFSTYLGGSGSESIAALVLDNTNDIFVTGVTTSSDFPTTSNAYYAPATGSQNSVFVTKMKSDGSGLLYSSVFGGKTNYSADLAVNSSGEVSVAGSTDSAFPATAGSPQVMSGNSSNLSVMSAPNAFIVKLTSDGQAAAFATYLGGTYSMAKAVAVDGSGGTYVTGTGDGTFPTMGGAFSTVSTGDIILAKIQDPSSCTYTAEQGSDALRVLVTTQPGCNWIAVSGTSWLGIGSGASGSGSGAVRILADSNNGTGRSGKLSIAGTVYTVTQSDGCLLTLPRTSQEFGADGGSGAFSGYIASGCTAPVAATAYSWIHIGATYGSSYGYSVDRTNQARTGTITLGAQTFTISQSTVACTFQVSPSAITVTNYTNQPVFITPNFDACSWTSTGSIYTNFFPSSGQGAGQVNISGSLPYNASPRTVLLTIAGQRVAVTIKSTVGAYIGGKIGVFRSGTWWIDRNADNNWTAPEDAVFGYGYAGDVPILGDWDNTGKLRIGVFRNGQWWVDLNGDNSWDSVHDAVYFYGQAGDIPVVADWNNTGRQRIGVFRNGQWWVDLNGDHIWSAGADAIYAYGQAGDIPIVGDWSNSGMQRIGVFRGGQWWLDMDGDHTFALAVDSEFVYGIPGDMPVVGDWDGTGRQRIGVLRNGDWWLDMDGDHQWSNQFDRVFTYGFPGDEPVVLPWP